MKRITLTLTLALVGTMALYSQNPNDAKKSDYYVRITDPANDGYNVGRQCKVTGEANIPSGFHLWVLCHRDDFPKWYAQASPKITQGVWHATANIGEIQDIGSDFEIRVVVVDDTVDAQLRSTYGQIIDLPDTDYTTLRIVHKINHK